MKIHGVSGQVEKKELPISDADFETLAEDERTDLESALAEERALRGRDIEMPSFGVDCAIGAPGLGLPNDDESHSTDDDDVDLNFKRADMATLKGILSRRSKRRASAKVQ